MYSPRDPGGYLHCGHWRLQHPRPDPSDLSGHLPHEHIPLRQRQQAPLMESYRHHRRVNLGLAELLEAREKGIEPLLLLHGSAPPPLCGALNHHCPGILWEHPTIILEVEPPILPPSVR